MDLYDIGMYMYGWYKLMVNYFVERLLSFHVF